MTFTAYIWKKDRRYKRGERLVSTTVWEGRSAEVVQREIAAVFFEAEYRIEVC